MIDFHIMASLNVIHKGGNNYLFTANGCHLEYFVIWADGEEPRWESVYGNGKRYQLNYDLESGTTYNFHVYDGRESKDFRGKMKYTTESDDDDDGYY